jgi:hypothetical protein
MEEILTLQLNNNNYSSPNGEVLNSQPFILNFSLSTSYSPNGEVLNSSVPTEMHTEITSNSLFNTLTMSLNADLPNNEIIEKNEMEEFYEMVSTKKHNQLEILMRIIEDMCIRPFYYGRKAEDIELVNVYGTPLEEPTKYLRAIRDKSSLTLTKLHELFLENYTYNYNDPPLDCLNTPLTKHSKFLNEIYFNINYRLETNEEYKIILEQRQMQLEEEETRRLMELEKLVEEKNNKKSEYYTKKYPCPDCNKLISRNNIAVHKKTATCQKIAKKKKEEVGLLDSIEIPIPKEEETYPPRGFYLCSCGEIIKTTCKTGHRNTKKCQRKTLELNNQI